MPCAGGAAAPGGLPGRPSGSAPAVPCRLGHLHRRVAGVFGAVYASRVTAATLHNLVGLPAPPGTVHRLAAVVASGVGTRAAAAVPPAARAAVTHAAHAAPS